MLRLRSAQVMIEYIMIVLLVCMALLVGGPVLKRSVFGAFKGQEDSIMDSFSEQIRQTSTSFIPPPACTCTGWIGNTCGANLCQPTEISQTRTCTPIDCDMESQCIPSATCCLTLGTVPVGCGTLVSSNTNENADVPSPPTRGAVYANNFPAGLPAPFNGPFDGTIYIGGNDTHDCLIGQIIVSRTCGLNAGGSYQGFACINYSPQCLPGCWGTPITGSIACDATPSNEYYRSLLIDEISYRKKGGVITGGVLTADVPNRSLVVANNATSLAPAYRLDNNPYTGGGGDLDYNIYIGTYLAPWTYFTRPAAGYSPECSATRRCERMCGVGDIVSEDRTSCATPRCDWLTVQDSDLAVNTGGAMTYISPRTTLQENFLITVESFNMNHIIGCFDGNGNIIGGVNQGFILPYPNAGCTTGPFTVSGITYCFQDNTALGPSVTVPMTATAVCLNSQQVALRIFNPSPKTLLTDPLWSNDFMRYRVDYQEHNIGGFVNLLVDDWVDLYTSDNTWTPKKLLYSTPQVTPPVNYTYPAEVFAPGAQGGNIYLLAYHSTQPGVNRAGISAQLKANGNCFNEPVLTWNTHGALAPSGSWLNSGCWIYSALNTGLDRSVTNPHVVRLQAQIPGNAPQCNCNPACAGTQYCIRGYCVTYNPSLCVPDVAYISSFETPNLVAGTPQIMTAAFDLWQAPVGPGVKLEYLDAAIYYPPPNTAIPVRAGNGNQFLQMSSANGPGTVITTLPFTTIIGETYRLSFYIMSRALVDPGDAIVNVTTPGGTLPITGGAAWQLVNIDFVAIAASSTVSFTDVDIIPATANSPFVGALIDQVVVRRRCLTFPP